MVLRKQCSFVSMLVLLLLLLLWESTVVAGVDVGGVGAGGVRSVSFRFVPFRLSYCSFVLCPSRVGVSHDLCSRSVLYDLGCCCP